MVRKKNTPVSWLRRLTGAFDHLMSFLSDFLNRQNLGMLEMGKFGNVYTVPIDYSKSLEQMMSDGQYDYIGIDITDKNFPIVGKGVVEVQLELVHFDVLVRMFTINQYFEKNGLRYATIEELLAFGAYYPNIQREFPVVALGSSWRRRNGRLTVPCLCMYNSGRCLTLNWRLLPWSKDCRFLAVPR